MNDYRYSPQEIGDYFIPGMQRKCEVGAISNLALSNAIWNLFWLSVPDIDLIPQHGAKWYAHYKPTPGAAASITADVIMDEVLYRKLCMHPLTFANWFESSDQSIFDAYNIFDGRLWVDTVMTRARAASARMVAETPALVKSGNVIQAVFGRAAAA